jgi:predicted dehydrogenase
MAILGGKHVYVEKPSSQNMFENELLVEAQRKYQKVVQMGVQQRSAPHTIQIIEWDGKSRNKYSTYGTGRGTIIYGTEGSVFVNRNKYALYDRAGKLIREVMAGSQEAGTALGGGGDMSTAHVVNFFDAIRGKADLTAHIAEGSITMALVHYSNIAYRIGNGFDIDNKTGRIYDREAMKLWGRDYEPGWEPKI